MIGLATSSDESAKVSWINQESPSLQPKEVLVEIKAIGVNRADLLQIAGKYPPPSGVTDILGLEFSGVVSKSLDNRYKLGDRVMGLVSGGAYATGIVVSGDLLMPLPDHLSFEEAAAIPEAFITAYQAMFTIAQLNENNTLLIHAGASGVGSAAIQLSKLSGCKTITTASAGKLDYCAKLGADICIDYGKNSFDQVLKEINIQPNAIIDFIGASYFSMNINCLALDGHLVLLGLLGGYRANDTNLAKIIGKRLTISGTTLRSRSHGYKRDLIAAFSAQILPHFSKNELKPNVDRAYSWKQWEQAHDYMRQNKNMGKIVLLVD